MQVGSKTTMRIQNRQYCGYAEAEEWCVYYSKSTSAATGKNVRCDAQMKAGDKAAQVHSVSNGVGQGERGLEVDERGGLGLRRRGSAWSWTPTPAPSTTATTTGTTSQSRPRPQTTAASRPSRCEANQSIQIDTHMKHICIHVKRTLLNSK
jgi:hypothetical protein